MAETEQELIEALRQYDRQAQRQVLERYGHEVFALVARLLTSREDAEEAYQDGFVKVFQGIGRYDETRSSLRTWLSRLAYHEAIDRLRQKRQPMVYYDDCDADDLSDEEAAETLEQPSGETVQLIRTALQHLPPEERAIITMFYYEERSLKEIAYITESLPTTVASRLSRTRKKLCRIIKMLQS